MSSAGKKKIRRNVTRATAHIKSTFNNTFVTISDMNGETVTGYSTLVIHLLFFS